MAAMIRPPGSETSMRQPSLAGRQPSRSCVPSSCSRKVVSDRHRFRSTRHPSGSWSGSRTGLAHECGHLNRQAHADHQGARGELRHVQRRGRQAGIETDSREPAHNTANGLKSLSCCLSAARYSGIARWLFTLGSTTAGWRSSPKAIAKTGCLKGVPGHLRAQATTSAPGHIHASHFLRG